MGFCVCKVLNLTWGEADKVGKTTEGRRQEACQLCSCAISAKLQQGYFEQQMWLAGGWRA